MIDGALRRSKRPNPRLLPDSVEVAAWRLRAGNPDWVEAPPAHAAPPSAALNP